MKNKKREVLEGATDSDHQTVDNQAAAMNSLPLNQNLTTTSSVGVWPTSRSLDMRNTHVDIDLMRG